MLHSFRTASGCAVCDRRAVSRDAGGRFADSRNGGGQCLHRAGTTGPGGFRQFGPPGAVPGSLGRWRPAGLCQLAAENALEGIPLAAHAAARRALDRTARISRRCAHRMATVQVATRRQAEGPVSGPAARARRPRRHGRPPAKAWDVLGTLCRTVPRRGRSVRFRRGRRAGIPASRPGARCKSSGNGGGSAWPANL